MKKRIIISVAVEPKLHKAIQKMADEHGRTKSDLIRFLLEIQCGLRKRPKPL